MSLIDNYYGYKCLIF